MALTPSARGKLPVPGVNYSQGIQGQVFFGHDHGFG